MPRVIVWGCLGVAIAMAFKVFSVGSPYVAEYLGIRGIAAAMTGGISLLKLVGSSVLC